MKKIISIILRVLVLLATVAAEALVCFCVLRLNILPTALTVAFVVLLLLVAGGLGVLLFVHKPGSKVGWVRTLISAILAVAVIAGCLFVSSVATEFYEAMLQITNAPKPNAERSVYVRADDPATTIQDAAQYTFGIVTGYDEDCTQQVLDALKEELEFGVKVQEFEAVTDMLDALYMKDVDAMILNGGYLSVLEENGYETVAEQTRVLYTVPVIQDGVVAAPEIEAVEVPSITNTPFVFYISGSDTRSSKLLTSRSDVNILLVVNPNTKQILMVNTPRDYYVKHPSGNEYSYKEKLTHCGIYGVDCSAQALADLYGIQIDYWAQLNFEGFKKVIDEIGGITVTSDTTFAVGGTQFYAGENTLNGEQALYFARDRYHQYGGDNGRGKNQMKVVKAVINKVTSGTTFLNKYSEIFASLDGMFTTSISMEQVGQLVKMQLKDMSTWDIQTFAVTGTGDSCRTYTVPNLYMYVMHPNEKSVEYASGLMQRVLDGEVLTAEDMVMPE